MMSYIYPLVLVLLLWQCQHDNTFDETKQEATSSATFGSNFALGQGKRIVLSGKNLSSKLYLTVEKINDSRCPANVICVHYGSAEVVLSAFNSQGQNELLTLCIGQCELNPIRNSHTITTKIGDKSYLITLTEVLPFPGLENNREEKVAKLTVVEVDEN